MTCNNPTVFSVILFPPALGPEITIILLSCFNSMVCGNVFSFFALLFKSNKGNNFIDNSIINYLEAFLNDYYGHKKNILIIMLCFLIKHSGDTSQTYLSEICNTFTYSEDQMLICSALLSNNNLISCNSVKKFSNEKSYPYVKTSRTVLATLKGLKDETCKFTFTFNINEEPFILFKK